MKLDPADDGTEPTVSVPRLWLGYNRRGFLSHRIKRVLPPTLVYLLVGVTVMNLLGMPVRPVRGAWSSVTDVVLLVGCVLTQIFLTFFVVDATQLSVRMIRQLATGASRYGAATLARHEQRLRISRAYLNEWLDIQIIAARTAAVSRLIFYPFITLGLMIAARNSFFDRWTWPAGLLIVMGCNLVIAVYAVVQLQRAAERAREDSLNSLRRKLLQVMGGNQVNLPPPTGATGTVNLAEQLRSLIRDIETCSEGAFAPLSRQPVIQALAVPTGGTGLLALFDFLVRF